MVLVLLVNRELRDLCWKACTGKTLKNHVQYSYGVLSSLMSRSAEPRMDEPTWITHSINRSVDLLQPFLSCFLSQNFHQLYQDSILSFSLSLFFLLQADFLIKFSTLEKTTISLVHLLYCLYDVNLHLKSGKHFQVNIIQFV